MSGAKKFLIQLIKKTFDNELMYIASELTLRLLVALLPMIMIIIAFIGTLNLETSKFLGLLRTLFPDKVMDIIELFIKSVSLGDSTSTLISSTLIFAVFSASSGFDAVVRGINKTYSVKDTRSFFKVRSLCIMFVFMFAFALILSIIILVFGDTISNFLLNYELFDSYAYFLSNVFIVIASFLIVLLTIMCIYKLSVCLEISLLSTMPGAIFTMFAWYLSSLAYNFYVVNYATQTSVYGAIGALILFIIWLNIIAFVLLLGSQINAILEQEGYNKHFKQIFSKILMNN